MSSLAKNMQQFLRGRQSQIWDALADAERASDRALRLSRAEDGPEICSRLSRRLAGCRPCTARFAAASLALVLASRLLHAGSSASIKTQAPVHMHSFDASMKLTHAQSRSRA